MQFFELSSNSPFLRHEVQWINVAAFFVFFKSGIGLPARLPVSFPSLPLLLMWEKSALWNSRSKQAAHPRPPSCLDCLFLMHCSSLGQTLLTGSALSPSWATAWALFLSLLASSPSAVLDSLHLRWVSLPCKLFPYKLLLLVRVQQIGSRFFGSCGLMPVRA